MIGLHAKARNKEVETMKESISRRLLACCMSVVLAVGMTPLPAFAEGGASGAGQQQVQTAQQAGGEGSAADDAQQAQAGQQTQASQKASGDGAANDAQQQAQTQTAQQASDGGSASGVSAAAASSTNAAGEEDASNGDASKAATQANGNGTYAVATNDELADALSKMANDSATDLTLVLKGGATFTAPTDEDNVSTFGIEGKKITVTSDGDAQATLVFSYRGMLAGACTFDNVKVRGGGKFYCNGFDTEFTKNSNIDINQTLYGGGYQEPVKSTHVVIAGTGNINPNGGRHSIIGGSYKGSVENDTYLEISGNIAVAGGAQINPGCMRSDGSSEDSYQGSDLYVGGSATLVYDNSNINVAPTIDGTDGCEMKGDVTLDIRSGYTQEITGQYEYPEKSSIRGNLHIIAGSPNSDRTLQLGGNWPIIGAGCSIPEGTYEVGGNITIDTYDNVWGWNQGASGSPSNTPYIEGAKNGKVGGSIVLNVNGTHVGSLYGAENSTIKGDLTINATNVDLQDSDTDYILCKNDLGNSNDEGSWVGLSGKATINMNGGHASFVSLASQDNDVAEGSTINVTGSPKIDLGIAGVNTSLPKGAAAPVVNLDKVEATIPYVKFASAVNVTGETNATINTLSSVDEVFIGGNSNVNVPKKFGCNNASSYEDVENHGLEIENGSSLTTDGAQAHVYGYAKIDGIWEQNYAAAEDYFDVYVAGATTVGNAGRFVDHGTCSLAGTVTNNGLMALMNPADFQGDYNADNAEVRLPVVASNYNGTDKGGDIPLIVDGNSTGKTIVNTVDPSDWQTLKAPAFGDNYIRSKADGDKPEQGTFVLGNQDAVQDGYYLKRVQDADGTDDYHMWQVAKQAWVTFDDNGANCEGYPITTDPKDLGEDETTTFDAPSDPSREGYKFLGWNMQQDGKGQKFESGKTSISKPTTVYAQWQWDAKKITVTFNENGGDTKADPASQAKTTDPDHTSFTFDLPQTNPTRAGYTFDGWYTEPEGGQPFTNQTEVSQDTTVYAHWKWNATDIKVTFDDNGAGLDGYPQTETKTTEPGHTSFTFECPTPTREGYEFLGWNTDKNGNGDAFDSKTEVSESKTVYAQWRKISLTVSYEFVNDGPDNVSAPDSATVDYGSAYTPVAVSAPENWLFKGWYTDKGCMQEFVDETPVTDNITLYGKWVRTTPAKPLVAAVSYKFVGDVPQGATAPDIETVALGEQYSAKTPKAVDCWDFDGWYTDESLKTPFKDDTVIKANTVLYGAWHQQTVTVTFDKNGGDTDVSPATATQNKESGKTSYSFGQPTTLPTREGFLFDGWNTKPDGSGTAFPVNSPVVVSDSATVYAQWKPDPSYAVTIAPMDLTIYVGGDGYSGVIGADGSFVSNDFPQMGFYLTLPAEINEMLGSKQDAAVNLANVATLEYNDPGRSATRSWKLQLYGDESQSHVTENGRKVFIYRVMPSQIDGGDQTVPFRTQFTDSTGKVMDDSSFVADPENQFRNYTASIYSGELDTDLLSVSFKVGDTTVSRPLKLGSGTLKIRGNNDEVYTDVSSETPKVDPSHEDAVLAGAAQEGTEYFVNDSGVRVTNASGVKLMVDRTLDDELLTAYLDEKENKDSRYSYEFNYLDLVDTNNGNAYVTLGEGQKMNVFWPVPDDAAADSDFHIVHFQGLDRDTDTNLGEMLEKYTPEELTGTKVEIDGKQFVQFSVSSFSPFALMYEKAATVSYTYVGESPATAELPQAASVALSKTYTAAPQKPVEGWTFDGWYTDEACASKFVDGSKVESDTTLYGKWAKVPVSVSYAFVGDAPDGAAVPAGATLSYGDEYAAEGVTEPNGWTFDGWYTDESCTTKFENGSKIERDTVLYGKWAKVPVKVSYAFVNDGPAGVSAPAGATLAYGDAYTAAAAPSADGWRFDGWFTDETCTTKFADGAAVTADTTLYGKWTKIEPAATLQACVAYEFVGDAPASAQLPGMDLVDLGEKYTAKQPASVDGYVFDGWYVDEACTTKFADGTAVDGNVVLYGKWRATKPATPLKACVSYAFVGQSPDGAQAPGYDMVDLGAAYSAKAQALVEGWEFNGWYTDEGCTSRFVDGSSIEADTILYGRWAKVPVRVTYKFVGDAPSGAVLPNDADLNYGDTYTAAAAPSVKGWTFSGWFTDEGCTTKYVDGTAVTADTTLYGKWAKVETSNPGGFSQSGVTPTTPQNPNANGGPQAQPGSKNDAAAASSGTFAKTADDVAPVAGIVVTLGVLALIAVFVAARKRNRNRS